MHGAKKRCGYNDGARARLERGLLKGDCRGVHRHQGRRQADPPLRASSDTEELALRIAASRAGDGGIDYRMGFDDVGVDDTLLSTNGVDVVIASADKALLSGTVLDYVEFEPGVLRFIFLNPNSDRRG